MPFNGALTGGVGALFYAMKWRIIHDQQIGAPGLDAAEEGSWSTDDLHAVMAALCRIGYPTPNKFAFASGMESRNLRTVVEFADQIVVVIWELTSCESPNQDGLPEKIAFDQAQQLYRRLTLFDELRSIDSLSNCSGQDCALFDAVKKHGLIDLSNQHFSGVILAMIKLRMWLLTALGHSRPLESDSESGSSPARAGDVPQFPLVIGNHLMINNLERHNRFHGIPHQPRCLSGML
jgi:hypothetical protein